MRRFRIWNKTSISRSTAPTPGYQDLGMVLLFIFLLPYIVSFFFGIRDEEGVQDQAAAAAGMMEETWETGRLTVCNQTSAGVEKMPLEAYLAAHLPATIQTEYEMEALKAQAVVLRTELIKSYYDELQKPDGGTEGMVFVESETIALEGEAYQKVKEAVTETAGMYLADEGKPLYAPYFSISAGATRNGNEVFGGEEYPYLKSVACPRDFAEADYLTTVKFNQSAFWIRFRELYPEAEGADSVGSIVLERDRADYVTNVKVGNTVIPGEVFRFDFSLNSACFTMEETKNQIKIVTKGVGHGIGFGQCAANYAAKEGSDFIDILSYFFSDAEIEKFE